ncbi:ParB/RepB/Spo0J family partition protein [Duganella callida]|uniref:ParB/RepB/Spo0J family partition protein n=1 Tax=Duganella callida TaxID=2561932 RepID=A0A4Y9SDT2_9BURK|nr:ParB/RepB/Spo0J family partition protein [Duganella callida]TFW17977.1 ParB/RepB/Spo0J family partition protein [Duganella callida]
MRTRFNLEALQQLSENIVEVGILQPILMRPVTPTAEAPQLFEIVAGERRFRAACMAGLYVVPASVKTLTDKQAAEIQLLENIQRENQHPLEEAIGFEQLMLNHGYNADQLASKVKQSRSYVYGRLKLCALANGVRDDFLDDKFSASIALLIARLPTPAMQVQAAQAIIDGNRYTGEPMSYRSAQQHIRHNYMLDIGNAVFPIKDARLVEKAGSCETCKKRTGNQPDVDPNEDDDDEAADYCTEPACYHEKTAAFQQRKRDEAAKTGQNIIVGDEAKKIMPNSYGSLRAGWSDIDKTMYLSSGSTNYRTLLQDKLPEISLLESPYVKGTFLSVARTDELEELVEGVIGAGKTDAARAALDKVREQKSEREAGIERKYRKELFEAVRVAPIGLANLYDERIVAGQLYRSLGQQEEAHLRKFWNWAGPEYESGYDNEKKQYVNGTNKILAEIHQMSVDQAKQLIRDVVLIRETAVFTYTRNLEEPVQMLAAAAEQGVDAAAIRATIAKEAKAKEKEKAAKQKAKAEKKAAKKPKQAEIPMPPPAEQPAPATDGDTETPARSGEAAAPREKLKLKAKPKTEQPVEQPVGTLVTVKKTRVVPASAWPFPTGPQKM